MKHVFGLAVLSCMGLWVAGAEVSWGGSKGFSPSGEAAKETIRSRKFQARRDLQTYARELPPEFTQALTRLGPKDRILDGGAGAIYFAEELVSLRQWDLASSSLDKSLDSALTQWTRTPPSSRPETVAVSLNLEREVPAHPRLKVIWGRFFAEIPDAELGRFDLIVDLQGIFAYSPSADEALRKYLRILKPGGTLYLSLGVNPKEGFAFRSQVKSKEGQVSLAQWAQSLKGIDIALLEGGGGKEKGQYQTLRIRPVEGKTPVIPSLSLMGIDSSLPGPPTRIYWQGQDSATL